MRLFIALILNDEMKSALISMQYALRRAGIGGNYTKRENLHLTLAFIGEYGDPDKVLGVIRSLEPPQCEVRLDSFGSFDGIWWAGIAENAALRQYASRLRRALAGSGIPFDKKNFSPHITLLRKPDRPQMPPLSVRENVTSPVRVALMRSDRGKYGVIYTEIE